MSKAGGLCLCTCRRDRDNGREVGGTSVGVTDIPIKTKTLSRPESIETFEV